MRGEFNDLFTLCNQAQMRHSISISQNGWTDPELGALWLEKDFAPATAKRLNDPGHYRLLILDGHNSHCTYRLTPSAKVDLVWWAS